MNVYGPRIATARKIAGLTQEALAEALGVDTQTVKRKENPRGKEPKKLERIAIAAICGVSLDYLEGDADDVEAADDPSIRRIRELEIKLTARIQNLEDQVDRVEGRIGLFPDADAPDQVNAQIERELAGEDRPAAGRAGSTAAKKPHLRRVDQEP